VVYDYIVVSCGISWDHFDVDCDLKNELVAIDVVCVHLAVKLSVI
jgi:hypothetical protein